MAEKTAVRQESGFHLKEFEMLRGEMRELAQETAVLERQAIFAVAAMWTWIATNYSHSYVAKLLWLPFILTLLAAVRALALYVELYGTRSYIKLLEANLRNGDLSGWEHHLDNHRRSLIGISSIVFWMFLIIGNLLAAILFTSSIPKGVSP